jgi:hypothetical protein
LRADDGIERAQWRGKRQWPCRASPRHPELTELDETGRKKVGSALSR